MSRFAALVVLLISLATTASSELPPSQIRSLLRLPKLLEYPHSLAPLQWTNSTTDIDLCGIPSNSSLTITCDASGATVVALEIIGDRAIGTKLSSAFSMESLGNLLSSLPDIETLSLVQLGLWGNIPGKLDHLQQLRSLNLSRNAITGPPPDRLASLLRLETLDISSNALSGGVPSWLGGVQRLQNLDLSRNQLSGAVPPAAFKNPNLERVSISHNGISGDLPAASASGLRFLNAGANKFGPKFPALGASLEWILLADNRIEGTVPSAVANLSKAVVIDLAYNRLSGSLPKVLISLPSIQTLLLNGNSLSGALPTNLSLSPSLQSLDISSNLFTGRLPQAFVNNATAAAPRVRFDKNCLATTIQRQYRTSHCTRILAEGGGKAMEAVAPAAAKDSHDMALIVGIAGGGIALLAAIALFLFVLIRCLKQEERQYKNKSAAASVTAPSSCADTASIGVPSDLLSNARYLSQSIRLGVLGAPQGRVFSLAELEEATASFNGKAVMSEGQNGRVFRGKLHDGTPAAVKCLVLDPRQDLKQLKAHVEFLVKVRHRHLVSYYGYCIDTSDSPRLFLISELLGNDTLRTLLSRSSGAKDSPALTWPQRLAAVIGAGRGIQFLHTGVVPGIYNNDVNVNNVLMDQNQVAKLTDFGLGKHARTSCDFDAKLYVQKAPAHIDLDHHRRKLASDKGDVYNFGFILLEIVLGRPATVDDTLSQPNKIRELEMLMVENVPRFEVIDPSIAGVCVAESLTTVLEIAAKCVCEDASLRPSMEDVLWNLQYAAQVQDRVSGEYSEELPYVSPPRSRFNRQAIRTISASDRR